MYEPFRCRGDRPATRIQEAFEKEAANNPRDFEKEVLAVWRATNEERARLGKGPISLDEVRLVDRCSQGHVDYSMKLAFGCEWLVLKEE